MNRSNRVIGLGFEPRTDSLEGYCSIQLSYPTIPKFANKGKHFCRIPLGGKNKNQKFLENLAP